MNEFLEMLGNQVCLRNFKGWAVKQINTQTLNIGELVCMFHGYKFYPDLLMMSPYNTTAPLSLQAHWLSCSCYLHVGYLYGMMFVKAISFMND